MKLLIPEWHKNAKCAGLVGIYDRPDRMKNKQERLEFNERAKRLCAGCPVIRECAQDALDHPAHASGVIRAGVCYSDNTPDRKAAKAHWEKVAA